MRIRNVLYIRRIANNLILINLLFSIIDALNFKEFKNCTLSEEANERKKLECIKIFELIFTFSRYLLIISL